MEAEKRWQSSYVEGLAGRQFWTRVGKGKAWAREAEESPRLEAVSRERLVKKQQAGKCLEGVVVNCELWELAIELWLLVVPSCVDTFNIQSISRL
jgi:hypothetical protein